MEYLWVVVDKRTFPEGPAGIFHELDSQRYERRKLEVFSDGRCRYADVSTAEDAEWGLSIEPIPTADVINGLGGFRAARISETTFEDAWEKRTQPWTAEEVRHYL